MPDARVSRAVVVLVAVSGAACGGRAPGSTIDAGVVSDAAPRDAVTLLDAFSADVSTPALDGAATCGERPEDGTACSTSGLFCLDTFAPGCDRGCRCVDAGTLVWRCTYQDNQAC